MQQAFAVYQPQQQHQQAFATSGNHSNSNMSLQPISRQLQTASATVAQPTVMPGL
jgi:hypothetical protein